MRSFSDNACRNILYNLITNDETDQHFFDYQESLHYDPFKDPSSLLVVIIWSSA